MNPKVLAVDDSPEITALLARLLRRQGCEVAVAHGAAEGLALAETFRPDVVLLDVMMPGMDGIEVCRQLKAAPNSEGVYVILVTAMSETQEIIRGLDSGADDYITKPFSQAVLAARLRAGLRIKAHRDALARANQRLQQEIAERCRAEAQAHTLRRRIEFVLEITGTGLDVVDAHLNLCYVDAGRRKRYGDPAGCTCYQYFCQRETPCPDCGALEALRSGRRVVTERVYPGQPDRPVEVTSFPYEEEGGRTLVAQVSVDLTPRKLLEAQALRAQRLEALGRLAASLAHQINTPNQYVTDNLRFLQSACRQMDAVWEALQRLAGHPELQAARTELFQAIHRAVPPAELEELRRDIPQAIGDALAGVAEVSRVVAAVQKFAAPTRSQKSLADVNDLVANALEVGRHEWRQAAEVRAEYDPALPPVPCVPSEIAEAVLEAVRGAVAAGGQKPAGPVTRVALRTRAEPGCAVIEVDDDGPPLPLAERERLFDPLTLAQNPGGPPQRTLATAHAIVVRGHGGAIELDRSPRGGTRVVLRLPVEPAASAAVGRPDRPAGSSPAPPCTLAAVSAERAP